jgi:O-antigen/teichoic acid export membrane protein
VAGVATTRRRLRDAPPDARAAPLLASAALANNAIALAFTVLFTRVLGAEGYGALAAVISAFLVLVVAGQSAQAMAAREAALEGLGDLAATLRSWLRTVALAGVALAVAGALAREPLAALLGVPAHPWAAAGIGAAGAAWLAVCLQRGVLQGLGGFHEIGGSLLAEPLLRIAFALGLVGAGLGVTGAFLGSLLSLLAVAAGLQAALHRRLGRARPSAPAVRRLGALLAGNRVPIAGLLLLAALQNLDVVVARRELGGELAGSYAACAVAAKAVVWVAVGIGLSLLPQAARRAADGQDPRPVLLRALAVLAALALPALAVFALAGRPLLQLAFGAELATASGALPVLGAAMAALAAALLGVQLLVALGDVRHVAPLALLVAAEPLVLAAGPQDARGFALVVLAFQTAAALVVLALALRRRAAWRAVLEEPGGP